MLASKIVSYGLAAAVAAMLVVTVVGAGGVLLEPEQTGADQKGRPASSEP